MYSIEYILFLETTIDALITKLGLDNTNTPPTLYRSGHHVDKIPPMPHLLPQWLTQAHKQLQTIVGSLNWLACGTRIDIYTITNMLAQNIHQANPYHIAAARYVAK
eukprot:3220961-Ditylum_brightwellii.AAC.1